MPFKQTIAAKIFALAVFLSLLTVALASYLMLEVWRTQRDLTTLARIDIPLLDSVSDVQEFGLRRRLAFERWFGALNAAQPNQEVIAEAAANYATFTDKLTAELARLRGLIDNVPRDAPSRETIIEIRTLLVQVEQAYPIIRGRQEGLIKLQQAGRTDEANKQINLLNDLQGQIQRQREIIADKMAAVIASTVAESARRQQMVVWSSVALTASAVLLGLVVAALITQRLTRPMKTLMTAMRAVQSGDLEVRLPVDSTDEVGALTDSFNYFVGELRSKEQIKRTFGRYIDPRVLEHLLQNPDDAHVAGGRSVMTVLFADLVGFTNLSERLTPTLMVTLLNRHFGLQAQALQEHHGVVDKFVGDAVMAFWGPPFVAPEDHAALACRAALAQMAAMATLRREIPELTGLRKEPPNVELRIGICTGDVVVGNIGSENTRSYTVIGDTVNLTARLEAANRLYRTHILLGESTALTIGDAFVTREIDALAVRGKTEPTRVFELLGLVGDLPEIRLRLRERYETALQAYRAQNWSVAESGFRASLELVPDDGPTQVLLERLAILRAKPIDATWDGTWKMQDK
jgi:class 3 adenylate cyclase